MMTQTTETSSQSNGTVQLPAEKWNRLLADARRRAAIRSLADRDVPLELSALAEDVVDRSGEAVEPTDVAVSLHHVHLPKLAECGVVEYDSESNRVTAFRAADAVRDRL